MTGNVRNEEAFVEWRTGKERRGIEIRRASPAAVQMQYRGMTTQPERHENGKELAIVGPRHLYWVVAWKRWPGSRRLAD